MMLKYYVLFDTPSVPRYRAYSILSKSLKYRVYCVTTLVWTIFFLNLIMFPYFLQTPLFAHINCL